MSRTVRIALVALGTGFIALRSATAASFTILGIGGASGVSDDGSVVVGTLDHHPARWTAQGGIEPLTLQLGFVNDLSADGSTAVGATHDPGWDAVRWTAAGIERLTRPSGYNETVANAVSADGSSLTGTGWIYATSTSPQIGRAFRWTQASGYVWLEELAGGSEFAGGADISADGSIIVGTSDSLNGREAYRWTAETGMVGLGDLPGSIFESGAQGVSADGSTVVGFGRVNAGTEAFRWTEATGMIGLGDIPGGAFGSIARAVSGDGSVVVGIGNRLQTAFIWTADTGMRSLQTVLEEEFGLDLGGVTLLEASDISSDGLHIVGYGQVAGQTSSVAWLASLPEPDPALLIGAALVALLSRRRGRPRGPTRAAVSVSRSAAAGSRA